MLSSSSWVNIPRAYTENAILLKSILPILAVSLLPTIISNWAAGAEAAPFEIATAVDGDLGSTFSFFYQDFFESFETILDITSAFVLVRLAKVIGADRDEIIARKIDEACRKYPDNSNFVVVIGMLHCNGVARKLLSAKR